MTEKKKCGLKQVEKRITQQFILLEETKRAQFISHGKMVLEYICDRCVPPPREHGSYGEDWWVPFSAACLVGKHSLVLKWFKRKHLKPF